MSNPNLLLVPGLLCDRRLWQAQIDGLKHVAECSVADVTHGDTIAALASTAIAKLPPGPFAVAGLSMGGYVALEVVRQAVPRVIGLALLDTSARPDSDQATADRRRMMKLAETDFERVVNVAPPEAAAAGPHARREARRGREGHGRLDGKGRRRCAERGASPGCVRSRPARRT